MLAASPLPRPFELTNFSRALSFRLNPFVLAAAIACCVATSAQVRPPRHSPLGIAWRVQGSWREDGVGHLLHTGDPIFPGVLLQPNPEVSSNSIIVLLPDGQRVLYDCFTQQQCTRGFRVPALYRVPDPFAVSMLARIRASLNRDSINPSHTSSEEADLPRDEAVVALGPDHRVDLRGLAAQLPIGQYSYNLYALPSTQPITSRRKFEKQRSIVTLSIPAPGIYRATIIDKLNRPRINLFLAAVRPPLAPRLASQLRKVQELLADWNNNYQGWPVHQFQRAYLEAIVLGLSSPGAVIQAIPVETKEELHAAQEPAFSPNPGVFDGDMKVALHCATPGAEIHFTVDSSQPLESSPIYRSPIVVKGTELTIKAFAGAPGMKDSAVVTGIFRIREKDQQ